MGEIIRTYAGASRTVVYASFSQYGTQLTYYWDKQTGVMVEPSTTSDSVTATAKATETNMWEAAATIAIIMRRKKTPRETHTLIPRNEERT